MLNGTGRMRSTVSSRVAVIVDRKLAAGYTVFAVLCVALLSQMDAAIGAGDVGGGACAPEPDQGDGAGRGIMVDM